MAHTSQIKVWLCRSCDAGYQRRNHAHFHSREVHGNDPAKGMVAATLELSVTLVDQSVVKSDVRVVSTEQK
jgi:hypothetical protein